MIDNDDDDSELEFDSELADEMLVIDDVVVVDLDDGLDDVVTGDKELEKEEIDELISDIDWDWNWDVIDDDSDGGDKGAGVRSYG